MSWRTLLFALGFVVLGVSVAVSTRFEPSLSFDDAATPPADGVEEWACPSGTVGRVECAYIEIPEDYSDPRINRIRVFTARIAPPGTASGPPIVFIGRELGTSTVGQFGQWQQVARATGREIVLVDGRGSGRSEPRYNCPGLQRMTWLESDLEGTAFEIAREQVRLAVETCHDRLDADFPLDAYSLDAMATDLDVVRDRLGINRWTVMAGGEATFVARRNETMFPSTVESLVLLGAVPTSADRHIAQYGYADEVLGEVLSDDLAATLDEVQEPLGDRSIVFTVTSNGRTSRVAVSSEVIRSVLARAADTEAGRSTIPGLVTQRMANENWRSIAILRAQQYRISPTWSAAVTLSVLCGDPSMRDAKPIWEAVGDFDTAWTSLIDDPTLDPELCVLWDAPQHDGVTRAPGAPTLVLNGDYDMTAPRSASDQITTDWPGTTVVTVDAGRPDPFDECVQTSLLAFLDPSTPSIPGSCA